MTTLERIEVAASATGRPLGALTLGGIQEVIEKPLVQSALGEASTVRMLAPVVCELYLHTEDGACWPLVDDELMTPEARREVALLLSGAAGIDGSPVSLPSAPSFLHAPDEALPRAEVFHAPLAFFLEAAAAEDELLDLLIDEPEGASEAFSRNAYRRFRLTAAYAASPCTYETFAPLEASYRANGCPGMGLAAYYRHWRRSAALLTAEGILTEEAVARVQEILARPMPAAPADRLHVVAKAFGLHRLHLPVLEAWLATHT